MIKTMMYYTYLLLVFFCCTSEFHDLCDKCNYIGLITTVYYSFYILMCVTSHHNKIDLT